MQDLWRTFGRLGIGLATVFVVVLVSYFCGSDESKETHYTVDPSLTTVPLKTTSKESLKQNLSYSFVTSDPLIDRIGDRYTTKTPIPDAPRNTGGRRVMAIIVAEQPWSLSFEQRAQIAMKAARDIQSSLKVDAVKVTLYPSISLVRKIFLAEAFYSPDGKGLSGTETGRVWDVRASPAVFTEAHLRATELWGEYRNEFTKNSQVNELALKKFLIKKYKLSLDINGQFLIPVEMNEYLVQ